MTAAEASWLRLLRDEGPQLIGVLFIDHPEAKGCLARGYSKWSGNPNDPETITAEGRAALAKWEAGK